MPMSRVSPVVVLVLTTIIESVRVPQRSLPASEPMSSVLTRGTSAHGSSAAVSARATSRRSLAVGDEHLVDHRRLHVDVAHGHGGRGRDQEAGHGGEQHPAPAARATAARPGLLGGEHDRADPQHRADHDGDAHPLEQLGLHGHVERRAQQAALVGLDQHPDAARERGEHEQPAEHLPAGAEEAGPGQHGAQGDAPVVRPRGVAQLGAARQRLGFTRPPRRARQLLGHRPQFLSRGRSGARRIPQDMRLTGQE